MAPRLGYFARDSLTL